MINPQLLLVDATLTTIVFSGFVVGTLLWKPRLWLQDFPPDIQAMIPPKTEQEERLTRVIAVPFFITLFGTLSFAAYHYGNANGFWALWLHVYLVWQAANLFDLIVIDWGGTLLIDPMNPPLPGTEGAKGYRDFTFHFVGFLKGSMMGTVLALFIAGAMWFVI